MHILCNNDNIVYAHTCDTHAYTHDVGWRSGMPVAAAHAAGNCLQTTVPQKLWDSLRGSPVKAGTTQRRLAWPLRKDDTNKPRSVNMLQKLGSPFPSRSMSGAMK